MMTKIGILRHTTFTGKERDEETGYGYFGARYMDHALTTMWLSIDPMADKYPSISPYAYCAWNPVRLVDPDGMELWKPEVYRNGDVSYKKEDGKEVYAKNASLSVTKETSRIGCPQPPKQIDPNRADSDLTQQYMQIPGNLPRMHIRIDSDNFERYSRDYYQ